MDPLKLAQQLNAVFPSVVPEFTEPRWWQLKQKSYIRWMDRNHLRYKLVDNKGNLIKEGGEQ